MGHGNQCGKVDARVESRLLEQVSDVLRAMISALAAVSMNRASAWNPSRVPTSVTVTCGRSLCGMA